MRHLEQATAHRAARMRVELGGFVRAGDARLPAPGPVGHELHRPSSSGSRRRAPTRSTGATRAALSWPAAAYAATIAAATRSPAAVPRVSANAVGPLPEIELPSAPAARAAAL